MRLFRHLNNLQPAELKVVRYLLRSNLINIQKYKIGLSVIKKNAINVKRYYTGETSITESLFVDLRNFLN